MADLNSIVAANLRTLRTARGWTQHDMQAMCEKNGTSINYTKICRFETRALPTITLTELECIAHVFDTTPAELLVPLDCAVCHGEPPAGFTCKNCGA